MIDCDCAAIGVTGIATDARRDTLTANATMPKLLLNFILAHKHINVSVSPTLDLLEPKRVLIVA